MKPHLRFASGLWWIGPVDSGDYFLWACCAPTVREVCDLWRRTLTHHITSEATALHLSQTI